MKKNTNTTEINTLDIGKLTRSRTSSNPELKNLLHGELQENVFRKSSKVVRSPVKVKLNPQVKIAAAGSSTPTSDSTSESSKAEIENKKDSSFHINNTFELDNNARFSDFGGIAAEQSLIIGTEKDVQFKAEFKDQITDSETDKSKNEQEKSLIDFEENSDEINKEKTDLTNLFSGSFLENSSSDNKEKNNRRAIQNTIADEKNKQIVLYNPVNQAGVKMTTQAQRLPLKYVANLVPDFDGKNMTINEYVEKLKHAKSIISAVDEASLIPILKIKLSGEIYKALINVKIDKIEDYIKAIKQLYPSLDNIHSLQGKFTEIIQKPNESVLGYTNRLQDLVLQIKEMKRLEAGITDDKYKEFEKSINTDAVKYFKNGLQQDIRLEMKEHDDLSSALQNAIEIESNLKKQRLLRGDANTLSNLSSATLAPASISKIYNCQICQDHNHEALFCHNSGCVYCKNKDHLSYNCKFAEKKIELICKFCNNRGHSIDACKFNKSEGGHCQYCQVYGHGGPQCPVMVNYELCYKCKKTGHEPLTCSGPLQSTKSCEFCDGTDHTIQNCPHAFCKRCNNVGHAIKYCPISDGRRTYGYEVLCTICNSEEHETGDCELVKVLAGFAKNNRRGFNNASSSGNLNNGRRMNFGNTDSYNDRSERQNNFGRRNNYLKCEYCGMNNHVIENCLRIKALKEGMQTNTTCSFCKKSGHKADSCPDIKTLENGQKQFCTICLRNDHTSNNCFRNRNSGNE